MHFLRFGDSRRVRALLVGLAAACSSPTELDDLAISLRPLSFESQEEWLQWPSTPTIEGGEALVVRGTVYVGCGTAVPRAHRRENVVGVEIRAVDTGRPCLASLAAWVPFEATVTGLAPGTYRVRVGVAGLDARTEGAATITAP